MSDDERRLRQEVERRRQILMTRAEALGDSLDRVINPIRAIRTVPLTGIAAGLATGVAGGMILSALRGRTRAAEKRPAGVGGDGHWHLVGAELLAAVLSLAAAWNARGRK